MPVQIGSLIVSMTTNTAPYERGMQRVDAITSRTVGRINRQVGIAERQTRGFQNSLAGFRPYSLIAVSRAFDNASDRAGLLRGSLLAATAVVGGFAGALSSNLILRYADSFTKLSNQVRVVSRDTTDTAVRIAALSGIAQRSRASLEATATLYSRIQKGLPDRPPTEVLRYVETIQKALTLGGATTEEARSAAIQFSQAIASNRLGGEELRAILETPLGLALAEGLGVTIGRFREMGHAGELTASVVLGALSKIEGRINTQFLNSVKTVDQALVQFDNNLTLYFGNANKAYGATQLLITGIDGLSNNLDAIIPTLLKAGGLLAAVFAVRNPGVLGGALGVGLGGALGNLVGGAEGAIIGGALGAVAGFKAPDAFVGFKEGAKAAREEVTKLTQAQKELRQATVSAGLEANRTKRQATADVTSFATPSSTAAFQRALNDENILRGKIADAVKAQNDAQNRLNTALARQPQIVKGLNQLYGSTRSADVQKYNALQKESISVAKQVVAEQKNIATAQTQISALRAQTATADLNVQRAYAGVVASGTAQARDAVTSTTVAYRGLNEQLKAVDGQLVAATRATTALGAAKAFLGRQITSIVGLFGGPWGLAITGAIALIGLMTLRSRENAQTLDGFLQSYKKFVDESKDGGVAANETAFAVIAKQIKDTEERMAGLIQQMRTFAREKGSFGKDNPFAPILGGDAAPSHGEFQRLREEIIAANGNVSQFTDRINALRAVDPGLNDDINQLLIYARALQGAKAEIQSLIDAQANLGRGGTTASFSFFGVPQQNKEVLAEIADQVRISGLKARGLTAEAAAQEYLNKNRDKAGEINYRWLVQQFEIIEANNKAASALKKQEKAVESFSQKLARLREEAKGSFLGNIDREVLERGRQLKLGAKDLEAYVKASKSGDFSGVSRDLMDVRDIEILKAAGGEYRSIIDIWGEWAQIAPLAAEKQAILNAAVQSGAITADQATLAYAKFITGFGRYQWIEQVSDAFGQFISDAVDGTGTLESALESLRKALLRIALETLAIEPLKNLFRTGLTSLFGGGNALSAGPLPIVSGPGLSLTNPTGLYHGGGDAGRPSMTRRLPVGSHIGAPRLHEGLTSGEYKAILQEGEHVLTSDMASRTADTVAGLSRMADRAGQGGLNVHVDVTEIPGARAEVTQGDGGVGIKIRRGATNAVAEDLASGGVVARQMEKQYGLRRKGN